MNRSKAAKERWEKWHCYRQAFKNIGFTEMTKEEFKKYKAIRPVELTLTRKDAEYLNDILAGGYRYTGDATRKRILNKLKKQGIK